MPVTGRVELTNGFGAWADRVRSAEAKALERAARAAVDTAHATTGGYAIGTVVSSVTAGPLTLDGRGKLAIWVSAADFRALFFEKGTLGNRRGGRKGQGKQSWQTNRGTDHRHPDALSAGHGVRAVMFLAKALETARRELPKQFRSELQSRLR